MSITGILLLGGFVVAASLMVARILPALLALPLMAAWIAWCAGLPFLTWANEVLLGGALRLSSAIVLVVFGAMFAKVIQKTGISDAIIKKAAEMAGDRPIAIAFLMLAATAFVFTGMSGLGAVLMVGSIVLPIMTSTGITPLDAAAILQIEAGDGAQQSGLAAARRAEEADELAAMDVEIDAAQGLEGAEALGELADRDKRSRVRAHLADLL